MRGPKILNIQISEEKYQAKRARKISSLYSIFSSQGRHFNLYLF